MKQKQLRPPKIIDIDGSQLWNLMEKIDFKRDLDGAQVALGF
jgi:hypothetical protein